MIGGLIFDFDGLILETEGPILYSWQELYAEHGCQLTLDTWAGLIGTAEASFDPMEALEKLLGQPLDRQRLEPRRRQRERDLILQQSPMPGVREILQDARRLGLKVGLASSSDCDWVVGHLSRLGLIGYFDAIKASDDVRFTKPSPELFLAAVTELRLLPEQVIVFEDSPNGILAARRAGMFCVAVPNALTRQLDTSQSDLQLDSLAQLGLEELIEIAEAKMGSLG